MLGCSKTLYAWPSTWVGCSHHICMAQQSITCLSPVWSVSWLTRSLDWPVINMTLVRTVTYMTVPVLKVLGSLKRGVGTTVSTKYTFLNSGTFIRFHVTCVNRPTYKYQFSIVSMSVCLSVKLSVLAGFRMWHRVPLKHSSVWCVLSFSVCQSCFTDTSSWFWLKLVQGDIVAIWHCICLFEHPYLV